MVVDEKKSKKMKCIKHKSNKTVCNKRILQRAFPLFPSLPVVSRVLCKINRYPFDKEMQDQRTTHCFHCICNRNSCVP